MEIRRATREDAARLAAIRRETLRDRAGEAYTDAQLATLTDADASAVESAVANDAFRVSVARQREEVERGRRETVVGYGTVHPADGQIHALFVDPDRGDEGVGSAILAVLERAVEPDEAFALSTPNAVGFYERRGYETVGEETLGDEPAIPVVRVEKRL